MENTPQPKKSTGFSETISFFHNRPSAAIVVNSLSTPFEYNGNIFNMSEAASIPFLLTQEYVYTLDSPIEHDRLINYSEQDSNKMISNLVIGRIKQFSVSTNDNFKQMFLENIPCYILGLDIVDASNFLMPALSKIVDEKMEIKAKFLRSCKSIVDNFKSKGKVGYCLIANNLVRLVNELYTIQSVREKEMKELIFDNYLKIASCLEKDDLAKFLLTKIISLSIDTNSLNATIELENVLLITKLIGNLADKFNAEHCETFILSNMKMFGDNANWKIREAVIAIIPPVAKAVSLSVFQSKINEELYWKLSKDTNEIVRKRAVEVLPELMKVFQEKTGFDPKYNNSFYIRIFKRFMLENNTEVLIVVMNVLGQFIQFLSIDEMEPVYLHFFANTIDEYYCNLKQNYSVEGKKELLYPAAFNFPAVLYRYSKESWPKLKKAFTSLATNSNDQVISTLISSFSEIGSILGQEIAEKELMPIYDLFISSSKPHLSSEAIRKLTKVIRNLSNDVKSKYLKFYTHTIPIDEENKINFEHSLFGTWRLKVETSQAIECFFPLFPPIVIYHQILPKMISFCIDDFAKVRHASAGTLAKIILFLLNSSQMKKLNEKLFKLITTFGYSKCFYVRQEFCKLSHQLISDQSLYQKVLKDVMLKLAYDKVKDVRISLGKLCSFVLKKKSVDTSFLLYDDDFYLLMSILIEDETPSVRNSILLQKHKVNQKKLIEKCNDIKAKKKRDNGIEEKEEGKEEKWCYLFKNDMRFFVEEFKVTIPSFALKRKDENNEIESIDYLREVVKEPGIKKIEFDSNGLGLNETTSEIIIAEDKEVKDSNETQPQNEIENGAINTNDNQLNLHDKINP